MVAGEDGVEVAAVAEVGAALAFDAARPGTGLGVFEADRDVGMGWRGARGGGEGAGGGEAEGGADGAAPGVVEAHGGLAARRAAMWGQALGPCSAISVR